MRGYDFFLVILAGLALLSFGAGDLVIALAFSGIGIPIALLIPLLPALTLILGLARILDRLLLCRLLSKGSSGFAGFGVALVLLASVSLTANQRQSTELAALLAGDHDNLARPLPDQTYALLSEQTSQECRDFCQRLLLTGQATAVLIGQGATLPISGTLWQIEDHPTCPPVALQVGAARMRIKGEAADTGPQADLLIGAGIAAGHCLIATPSTLAVVDTVIVDATLHEPLWDPGFSFGKGLTAAKRYSVWVRTDKGLTEQARWTYVSARQMFPLAIPVIEPGMNTKTKIGFARIRVTGYAYDPGFDSIADQTLGLRLALTAVPAPVTANGEDPLLEALKTSGALAANIQQLLSAKMNTMFQQQTNTTADRVLFLQILSDPRVPLQWRHANAVGSLLRDASPDFAAGVAKIGFARMNDLLLPDQNGDKLSYKDKFALLKQVNPIKAQIGVLGDVLAQLPDSALQPYGPAIFALAKDRENRTEPYQLLVRLSGFGDLGARALVDLLADADSAVEGDPLYRDHHQHAYLAAMIGLCQMGPKAAAVLPDLLKLVGSGEVILSDGPHGVLGVETLIRLGQPAESIAGLATIEEYPIESARLERAIARAQGPIDCGF